MARADLSHCQVLLYFRRQVKQSQSICDDRSTLANAACHLLVGELEIADELLVRTRFFQWS